MERKDWNLDEFVNGTNRLPEAYHWRVVVDAKRKPVVQVSLDPGWGTHVEETENPSAPIVDIPTSWENLIRLAVQIGTWRRALVSSCQTEYDKGAALTHFLMSPSAGTLFSLSR
jgi:hypothetical protein